MEQTSAPESLDIELPSGSLTSSGEKEESAAASDQLSKKGNSNSQLDSDACLDEKKDSNSSSATSIGVSDGNPRPPSQVTNDQKKESLESVVEHDQQQNSTNSRDSSTIIPGASLATTSAVETSVVENRDIDTSLQSDLERNRINDENSVDSPIPLPEESGNVLEESDKVLEESAKAHEVTGNVLEESDKVIEESANAHKESGNVLEESDNVLEEFLTLKTPHDTSLSDEKPEAQNIEDANSHETSNEKSLANLVSDLNDTTTNNDIATRNKDVNTSDELASRILFESHDVETSDKTSPIVENREKCMNNDLVQPNDHEKDNISSHNAGNSSDTNNVEQDMCALFSDSDPVDNSENLMKKDENKRNEAGKTDGSIILESEIIGDADPINPDVVPTKTTLPDNENTNEDSLRHKNIQIKDVNTSNEEFGDSEPINSDVLPTKTTLPDNENTGEDSLRHENIQIKHVNTSNEILNSVDNPNIPVEIDSNRIEIKEEIESIGYDNSNSLQGFENYARNVSYSSDCDLENMIDLCGKECFVKLKRCDASLLNVANPYQSDMKIVSVESLSSVNFSEKYDIVWSYFIKKSETLAECKICGKALSHKRLFNLTRHLQVVHDHNSFDKNIEQDEPSASKSMKSRRQSSSTIKQQPMNYFSFVNSQTARCKLCSQYMPYRCLDDLGILKSHLLLKHSELECSDSSIGKKSAKAEQTVSSLDEEEEDGDDDDDDSSGQNSGERKPRQRTWSHFTKLERGLAQCNVCLKCFSYGGGNLRSLTRHLKIGHNVQTSSNRSKQKAVPPQKKQKAQALKKKPNSQNTKKNLKLTRQSPAGKEFLKYFSFLRSDNALCKKCNSKVPYNNKDTKSLLNHYHQCNPRLDSAKKSISRKKILDSDVDEDESIKDPDFVPSDFFEDQPDPNKNKTQLMAAVELSPKENIDWSNFKKLNGTMVQCVHCSKKLSFKRGDTLLLEQHLQLWHGKKATKSSKDDGFDPSLDDIPLLFRLKNQTKPYTLGDCYYRKKLQYNLVEIGRYFRKVGDGKLLCKLCSKHLNCSETSTEILMSHILQDHVRKLFKPRVDEANTTETKQPPVSMQRQSKPTPKAIASNSPPPLSMRKVQAQSTPLSFRNRPPRAAAANPKVIIPNLISNADNIEQQVLLKSTFTLKYFIDFGSNRQQCKICNRQFVGKKSSNLTILSKHLLSNHLKNVVDDETKLLKSNGEEQRKAIINCTRRRIVNKFSKVDSLKILCKMCSSHLQNDGFETMKVHLLKDHPNYLITILKEVKRIQNYNCTDLRKTKKLLSIRKKRTSRAKCSVCSREVFYRAGNTKHLFNHLLKLHKTSIGKISLSKLKVWKYFTKKNFAESKCEICFKFISSKIHCNHKVPKLFCLSTGLKLKPSKESTKLKLKPGTKSTELKVKDSSSCKNSCFYFSALKQYNSECIFCSKSLKNANKIICKIACRFNHGNEYINWLYKNDPVDQTFISANQTSKTVQKTLSLLEMFEELKNKKMNSIKLWYSEFSNKYHCNLCSDNVSAKYLRFSLYFDHALVKHQGLLSMHRVVARPFAQLSGGPQPKPQSVMNNVKSPTKPAMQKTPLKNTKLVKVKLWHHFKVTGTEIATCNFCKTNFRYTPTNVDSLSTHLRVAHLNDLVKLSEPAVKSPPTPSPAPTRSSLTTTTATAAAAAAANKNKNDESVKKSDTWNYFTESNRGAKCKLCAKQFLFSQRTHVTPLTRHLKTVHNIITTSQEVPASATNLPQAEVNETAQSVDSKEQQTKWAWQYFEKDNVRPLTAKCKLCSIHCSCTGEQGDLSSNLLKHLRLVHNKWLVNVGKNQLLQNNQGAKRQADTDLEASSLVDQAQKRVKFNDSIDNAAAAAAAISDNNTTPTTTPTPTPKKSQTPSKNSKVVSGQVTASKVKKSLKRFQELEKTKSKKSLVWTYFTPIDGQPDFSRCNVCSKSISSKFGISILRTHLRVKHNILIVNMNQYSELKKSIGDTSLTHNLLTGGPSAKTNIAVPPDEKQVVSPTKTNSNDLNFNSPTLSNKSENSSGSKFDKNHPVWSYFKEEKNSNLLKCNLCSVYLSCKGERAEGLQNHLSAKHNIVFLEADPLKNVTPVSGDKSSPVQSLSTNQTDDKEPVAKPLQQTPMTAKELYETANVVESIVENEVFYTTEDNLVTVTERGDPSADETVHYEIVETTQHTEVESTDIVKVISELLPNYSVGISEDVNATEISPQESDLISNIVTSLSNHNEPVPTQQAIIDGDQLKSIAVLTGETEDTSLAWDFYVKLGDNKVKCDVCSEVFTYEDKDAAHLTEHIQSKHPAELAQYKLSRLGFSDSCIIVVKNSN